MSNLFAKSFETIVVYKCATILLLNLPANRNGSRLSDLIDGWMSDVQGDTLLNVYDDWTWGVPERRGW